EDGDGGLEHHLPAVEVGELAVQGRARGRGEQVRRHHPGQMGDPAEFADDRRQGRGHDGLIERRQEHAQHQGHEDQEDVAAREPGCYGRGHVQRQPSSGATYFRTVSMTWALYSTPSWFGTVSSSVSAAAIASSSRSFSIRASGSSE